MILMIDRLVSQRSLEKERRANIMQEHPAQLWSGEVTDDAVMEAAAGGGCFLYSASSTKILLIQLIFFSPCHIKRNVSI